MGIFEQTLIFFQCKQDSIMYEKHKDLDVRNLAAKNKSSNSNFYNYTLYVHESVSLTLISHWQYIFWLVMTLQTCEVILPSKINWKVLKYF